METKQIWANLSVKDLERTHEFYTKLGFKPNGKFSKENGLVSFLVGQDEFVVHFFSEENLKPAMGGENTPKNTTTMKANTTTLSEIVSREEWLAKRKELLKKEKQLTQARDVHNAERRRLPMVKIEKIGSNAIRPRRGLGRYARSGWKRHELAAASR